ncbi:MAG: MATE family efflux transporter [Clostridia bacterium]|nr:MATE family efflux transporter [Clostridia bacterium]
MQKNEVKNKTNGGANDYLIVKKPLHALLIFALPIIIGNMFQQLYTLVDSAVVGRYVGITALAAVGASTSLTNIFIFVAAGGGMGASVIVSRYFGAKEYRKMKSAVYTAMISFLVLSLVLAALGLAFGKGIMLLLKTPADALDLSVEYLNIYFYGLPLLFMYNIISSMFNALGKSKIPLVFLIFSSVLNVVLDVYMVTVLGMGIAGVAWATFIAQGISAVLSFAVFMLEMKRFEEKSEKIFDKAELSTMTRVALPSILQQSTVSIGLMLVQSVVNSFGSEVLAGFTASMRVESLVIVPFIAIGNALSSYTAQNLGAGKSERVAEGYRTANVMVAVFAVIICLFLQFCKTPILEFFLGEELTPAALKTGLGYMSFMSWFYALIGYKMSTDGLLRGAGDMVMFTVANLINLSLRVILATALAPIFGVEFVWYAVPVGWLINFALGYLQYRTGKWKRIFKEKLR